MNLVGKEKGVHTEIFLKYLRLHFTPAADRVVNDSYSYVMQQGSGQRGRIMTFAKFKAMKQ